MVSKPHRTIVCVLTLAALAVVSSTNSFAQRRVSKQPRSAATQSVARDVLLRIVRAEDQRRWDNDLRSLLTAQNPAVRTRAALAAGRIGNEDAVPALIELLDRDQPLNVRTMAAFALGEIESASGVEALMTTLKEELNELPLRAKAIEALGKIAAALPTDQKARAVEVTGALHSFLTLEGVRRSAPNDLPILLALTAALRAKAEHAGPAIAQFLHSSNPRIRADTGNTLARLKLKDESVYLRKLLQTDADPVVRANAARVLGATEDKLSFDALLDRGLKDKDSRVRVSAIRALALLKDSRASGPLMARGTALISRAGSSAPNRSAFESVEANELLEIATVLGRLRQNSNDESSFSWLKTLLPVTGAAAPEVTIAGARIHPGGYLAEFGEGTTGIRRVQETVLTNWRAASGVAQGLGEIATLAQSNVANRGLRSRAEELLRAMLDYRNSGLTINTLVAVHSEYAIPDVLRALAAFKPDDLAEILRRHLKESDVVVRGTAADLLGDFPFDINNIEALGQALRVALNDKESNDAALSIIDALGKQKNRNANQAIMAALDSPDYLVRRRAITALKATGAGDFSSRAGNPGSRNTTADYQRAISRIGRPVLAAVSTTKGSFTIELLPEAAPLNVDNFVQLAKRGYFNGITFHRVVPNFVIQGGDPRGDGNGGPGYQIRCEINQVPYQRGAVGMALSGKDTGGSQWFVTHSPQPHLDGGYTVFGKVIRGMDVVDSIVRGDAIRSIAIIETVFPGPGGPTNRGFKID